jgi:ribonuclease HI
MFILQKLCSDATVDIICLQEPGLNSSGHPPNHPNFQTFSPSPKPKCVTYIRICDYITASSCFREKNCFQGTKIQFSTGEPFSLYNIYSPARDTAFGNLIKIFTPDVSSILIGDFNCHHAWWYGDVQATRKGPKTRRSSPYANEIVSWMEDHNFQLHNIPGVSTYFPRNFPVASQPPSVIDLCFSRGSVSNLINTWTIDESSTSDHAVIGINLNRLLSANLYTNNHPKIRAWHKADWKLFTKEIDSMNFDFNNLYGCEDTSRAIDSLRSCIDKAIDIAVPLIPKRNRFTKWWNPNLSWLSAKFKRAQKRARISPSERHSSELQAAKMTWEKSIKTAKEKFWTNQLTETSRKTIWKVTKTHTNTHNCMIPPLNNKEKFEDKCNLLRSSLFPIQPSISADPTSINLDSLQDLTDLYSPVTSSEITRALNKSDPNSACGHDRIGYNTIKKLHENSPQLLPPLISAIFKHGIHHDSWKKAICIVIPKPGKRDYSLPESYRPISLLPCMGKLIERIAALRIMKAGIECGAISKDQFGGKPDHSAIDALVKIFTETVELLQPRTNGRRAFRPSLATHDIKGAFNNTDPKVIIEIMQKRRMPSYLIRWTEAFLRNRLISFSFDGKMEEAKEFKSGIPQGSPVSPVLFLIVMSAIMDQSKNKDFENTIGYMDDINDSTAHRKIEIAAEQLEKMFQIKEQSARDLGLSFDPKKSKIMHLGIKPRQITADVTFYYNNQPITLSADPQVRILGVTVDQTYSFIMQAQNAASKGAQALGSFLYLRSGTTGISPSIARYISLTVIFPTMFWASPAWWLGNKSIAGPLSVGYNKVARWITGLPPSTSIQKLLYCAHLPPMEVWLDYISTKYAIRTLFSPPSHALKPLPKFEPLKAHQPGIHRILSFVKSYVSDRLENTALVCPYSVPIKIVHLNKTDALLLHNRWIKSLPQNTLLLYTDGSKSDKGNIGAGWSLISNTNKTFSFTPNGFCFLGERMEVYDAELHAVVEGLQMLTTNKISPTQLYICIDNSAAVLALSNETSSEESAVIARQLCMNLADSGWILKLVWTPSHQGIAGNEKADEMAKQGTEHTQSTCTQSYTSKSWMKSQAKARFFKLWSQNSANKISNWNYPLEWERWNFRESKAIFRIYCGRTEIDPLPGRTEQPCKCGTNILSCDHLLKDCTLFDSERHSKLGLLSLHSAVKKEEILDKICGPKIRLFAKSIGLG